MKKFPIFIILMALLTACKQVVTFPFSTSTLPTKTPSPAGPTSTSISAPTDSDEGLIAFASWKNDDWQIHVMNADGTGDQRVDDRHGYEPNWSPDGKKIIFQYSGLWIADLASGVLTDVPLSVAGNNLPNEYMVKPAWSPDEQWIAFLNESGLEGDLYLVHPDGTNLQRLTTTDDISRDGNLVWSPDGKYIAYSANRDGNIEIYLLDVASAQQGNEYAQQLTETVKPVQNFITSWSRDGSWLAFSSDRDGDMEIYLMMPDGSNLIRLTDNPACDSEPSWSPDGKEIAFTSDRDGDVEIYVLNVEGAIKNADNSNARRLTNHPGDDVGPVWMPVAH